MRGYDDFKRFERDFEKRKREHEHARKHMRLFAGVFGVVFGLFCIAIFVGFCVAGVWIYGRLK